MIKPTVLPNNAILSPFTPHLYITHTVELLQTRLRAVVKPL
jgi:hypothetical protein